MFEGLLVLMVSRLGKEEKKGRLKSIDSMAAHITKSFLQTKKKGNSEGKKESNH